MIICLFCYSMLLCFFLSRIVNEITPHIYYNNKNPQKHSNVNRYFHKLYIYLEKLLAKQHPSNKTDFFIESFILSRFFIEIDVRPEFVINC